jgi:hypothetical protein
MAETPLMVTDPYRGAEGDCEPPVPLDLGGQQVDTVLPTTVELMQHTENLQFRPHFRTDCSLQCQGSCMNRGDSSWESRAFRGGQR